VKELHTNSHPTHESIEDSFDGNLCRCTGYRPILDGAKSLGCSGNCSKCPSSSVCPDLEDSHKANVSNSETTANPCSFPLKLLAFHQNNAGPEPYTFEKGGKKWIQATNRKQLVALLSEYPHVRLFYIHLRRK
jgi:xanthine dehydrogenase/oxidase